MQEEEIQPWPVYIQLNSGWLDKLGTLQKSKIRTTDPQIIEGSTLM
jgi:hypothetical protein